MLWPLDCPDDILEAVIKEVKRLESDVKLALDKDGLQVPYILYRLPKTSRNIWMKTLDAIGMLY